MRFLLITIIFFVSLVSYGQGKYDYNWMFGYPNVEGETDNYGMRIYFGDTISINTIPNPLWIYVTNTSMSNENGEFQYYSNGCSVSNYLGEIVDNGDSLNPGQVHDIQCETGYSISQGILSIPKPGNNKKFMLFHQGIVYWSDPGFQVDAYPLYLTEIDMETNDGEGKVIDKNKIMLADTLFPGYINGIKHENEIDWWLHGALEKYGNFYRFLIKEDTIEGPFYQELPIFSENTDQGGQSLFSPDGTRYIEYKSNDGIYIYDFDRGTGLVDFDQRLPFEEINLASGCAVSSNSRFLYINTITEIYQYDLEAEDVNFSKTLVAEYDGYLSPFPTNFFLQQLGPDCRIYITATNGVDVLHVINHPNRQGVACEVMQHAIQLPWRHSISMPNFANFRTGSSEEVCDSTIALPMPLPTSIVELAESGVIPVSVYPNPVKEELTVQLPEDLEGRLIWRLYDGVGREVMREQISEGTLSVSYPMDHLTSGLYFYGLERAGVLVAHGKLMKH